MNTAESRVRLEGITHRFGPETVLEDVSLDIAPGELLTLLGPSGCGKTTLLRIVAGFERPSEGRVLIDGEDVTSLPANRRPTNLVFQRPTLFPHLDVFANVAFGLQVARVSRAEQRERVARALALMRLEGYEKRRSHELSGGQMQRIALARALVNRPAVLLLDEPLSALDLKIRLEMEVELRRVHRETGATFVYVTHDQREAMALSDRLVVMNQGRVEQVGQPTEVYSSPASVFAAQFVGNANVLPVEVLECGPADALLQLGSHTRRVDCVDPSPGPGLARAPPGGGARERSVCGQRERRPSARRRPRCRLPRHRLLLPHRALGARGPCEGRDARRGRPRGGPGRFHRLGRRSLLAAAARPGGDGGAGADGGRGPR